jgi:hypothetical protein
MAMEKTMNASGDAQRASVAHAVLRERKKDAHPQPLKDSVMH